MKQDILKYESTVWKTADLLIGAGIKQSDFPKYMMPFFALIMVESRFVRMADELKNELKESGDELSLEEFIEEIKDQEKGYNTYLFEHNKTLADICKNDKTFERDFDAYLLGFDAETKDLLGVNKGNDEEKYLDISGVSGLLNKKKILFSFVKAWSEINLEPFSNSEITTLEEHIKRKWADISAETAGEQYTPDDVIALISHIISATIEDSDRFLTIYDPTCGGGNMLYGVEDRVNQTYPNRPTATYGQDWNDAKGPAFNSKSGG
jgi:type I restriction enzyme M protein